MYVGVIIPVHNFDALVEENVAWCYRTYTRLGHECKVQVLSDIRGSKYEFSGKENSLKNSILKAVQSMPNVDCYNIIEADAIPNEEALRVMLQAYQTLPQVGGISPVYKWKDRYCYPTHQHWFNDPVYQNGIRKVGTAGIPFLFSLWKPEALRMIDDPGLPEVYHLDTLLGKKVVKSGMSFYRMLNCEIEHYRGGRNK